MTLPRPAVDYNKIKDKVDKLARFRKEIRELVHLSNDPILMIFWRRVDVAFNYVLSHLRRKYTPRPP